MARSIEKQDNLIDLIRRVITTPTICSAASSFLIIFSDLATVITMMKGKDAFKDYIEWLHNLLVNQIRGLKEFLGVDNLANFDPKNKD